VKAKEAPVSSIPASYMQGQHIQGTYEQQAKGLDYSRLLIATCELPGRCDIRAMSYVINAHIRRHDTYRSWFECDDKNEIVRRTMEDPADIQFVASKHGQMSTEELHELILSTKGPLEWDCFSFGVVQTKDSYAFYVAIDHLHMDAMFIPVIIMEFHLMYLALVGGNAPLALPDAGSYDAFCVRQHEYTTALTLESPEVKAWIELAEANDGTFADFPLPLGDSTKPSQADLLTVQLMDEEQTAKFESECVKAGSRFIGGVMAAAGFANREFTGCDTYYGLTPTDTRSTPEDLMTLGWYTGLVPVTVPLTGGSFADAAKAAQMSFDSGTDLANIPFYRVLELAPWLSWPRPNFPVVNFFDAGVAPLSTFLTTQLDNMKIGIFGDGRYSYQMSIFVIRLGEGTAVSVVFPKNPEARESVARYVATMKSVVVGIAEGRGVAPRRTFVGGLQ
jgi:hypothetical protein